MKKVNVVLSTYNGEKYLSVQLDSLLNQNYRNISIYIRDDGSSDKTLDIIKQYEMKTLQGIDIHLLEDDCGNLGYVKSFLKIIRQIPDADYYAFCDQDDYWLPDKIERAVTILENMDSQKCLLYTSAYEVCDGNLKVLEKGHIPTPLSKLSVGKALSLYDGGWLLGFTCIMNHTLKDRAFNNSVVKMYSHDIWVQAVTVAFNGEIYIDKKVTAYFRRHINSTSIAESKINKSVFANWKYRWNETFRNGQLFSRIKDSICSFSNQYQMESLKKEDKIFLNNYSCISKKNSQILKKFFYPYRLKKNILVEFAWRLSILMGKL
jgi:rhamnosyltransferase